MSRMQRRMDPTRIKRIRIWDGLNFGFFEFFRIGFFLVGGIFFFMFLSKIYSTKKENKCKCGRGVNFTGCVFTSRQKQHTKCWDLGAARYIVWRISNEQHENTVLTMYGELKRDNKYGKFRLVWSL